MQNKGRIVLTGEVSDTPVIRATLQGLYTATFSLTSTTRRMNRAGVYTDRAEAPQHCRAWRPRARPFGTKCGRETRSASRASST